MSIITIKERVDAIKEGSSAYNYYMSTPLSELKTRDEKLIKQELEKRSLKLLSESDDEEELDNNTTTQVDDTEELEYPNDILDKTLKGAAIGAGAITGATAVAGTGLGIAMIPWQDIYSGFKSWVGELGNSVVRFWNGSRGYTADQITLSAERAQNLRNNINNGINQSNRNVANAAGIGNLGDLRRSEYEPLRLDYVDIKDRFPNDYGNLPANLSDLTPDHILKLYQSGDLNDTPKLKEFIDNQFDKLDQKGYIIHNNNGTLEINRDAIDTEAPLIQDTVPSADAFEGLYSSGAKTINGFANWVDKQIAWVKDKYNGVDTNDQNSATQTVNSFQPSTASYTIVWTVIVAIIIIAVYGIWKLVKWFIKDNGKEKSENEIEEMEENPEEAAASEGLEYSFYTDRLEPINEMENPFSKHFNPLYNNVSLAILKESDEAEAAMNTDSDRFSVKIAIKLSGKLANDSKFVNYMSKTVPVILKAVEQYSNVAKPEAVTESLLYEADESTPALPEETEDASVEDQKGFFTRSWDMIVGGIKKAGLKISSSVSSLKDKIVNLYVNLDDGTIRWIPTIVTTAITILAGVAAYLMMKSTGQMPVTPTTPQIGETPEISVPPENTETVATGESRNTYNFLDKSITALSLFNEAVENNIKKGADPFAGLSGKGEKLANNILDKAFKVSVDYVKDDEFITFYKKYNPEYLTTMKKYVNSDYKKAKGSKLVKATPNVKK